jgi:hypothetical protein
VRITASSSDRVFAASARQAPARSHWLRQSHGYSMGLAIRAHRHVLCCAPCVILYDACRASCCRPRASCCRLQLVMDSGRYPEWRPATVPQCTGFLSSMDRGPSCSIGPSGTASPLQQASSTHPLGFLHNRGHMGWNGMGRRSRRGRIIEHNAMTRLSELAIQCAQQCTTASTDATMLHDDATVHDAAQRCNSGQ